MFSESEFRKFDLNLLFVFSALFREGSATRAAKKLNIGAPAVSMALARLRRAVGDPLFVRVGNRFNPTSRAHELMRLVEPSLEQIHSGITGSASFDPETSQRTFRLGCSDDIDVILSPLLARSACACRDSSRFAIQRSHFQINPVSLERGEVDMAIGTVKDLPKWINRKFISSRSVLCLIDPRHVRVGKGMSHDMYLDLPHVAVSSSDRQGTLDETFASLKKQRYVAHTTSHFSAVPLVLKQGRSVATLPDYIARQYARVYRLKTMKPPIDFGKFDIHLAWHRKDENDLGHRWLRANIEKLLRPALGN